MTTPKKQSRKAREIDELREDVCYLRERVSHLYSWAMRVSQTLQQVYEPDERGYRYEPKPRGRAKA